MDARIAILGLVCLSLCTAVQAGPPRFASPQEVFEAQCEAFAKRDWKALWATESPVSQLNNAQLLLGAVCVRAFGQPGDQAAQTLLKAHNIDMVEAKKIAIGILIVDEEEQAAAAIEAILDPMLHKLDEFLASAFTEFAAKDPAFNLGPIANSELRDVQINGNLAQGNRVTVTDGVESKTPIHFVRVNGAWYLNQFCNIKLERRKRM